MSQKSLSPIDGPGSRVRTAQMLRRLRGLTREVRVLKANIDAAAKGEVPAHPPERRTGTGDRRKRSRGDRRAEASRADTRTSNPAKGHR